MYFIRSFSTLAVLINQLSKVTHLEQIQGSIKEKNGLSPNLGPALASSLAQYAPPGIICPANAASGLAPTVPSTSHLLPLHDQVLVQGVPLW